MLELNFTLVILIVLLLATFVFVGKEFEERYPSYVNYKDGDKTSIVQQMRAGSFIVLDYVGDMLWPGDKDQAIYYKRAKKTAAEIKAGK